MCIRDRIWGTVHTSIAGIFPYAIRRGWESGFSLFARKMVCGKMGCRPPPPPASTLAKAKEGQFVIYLRDPTQTQACVCVLAENPPFRLSDTNISICETITYDCNELNKPFYGASKIIIHIFTNQKLNPISPPSPSHPWT